MGEQEKVRHPQADPDCPACEGVGWLIGTWGGDPAVQRCDECLHYGDDDPRTVWDKDVAPLAIKSGVNCEAEYPCMVLVGSDGSSQTTDEKSPDDKGAEVSQPKSWVVIEDHLYDLGMLVEAIPNGPQGIRGYHLKFCNGSFVKFTIVESDRTDPRAGVYEHYRELVAIATAIRKYLYDRTIRVAPGPFESDRHLDY